AGLTNPRVKVPHNLVQRSGRGYPSDSRACAEFWERFGLKYRGWTDGSGAASGNGKCHITRLCHDLQQSRYVAVQQSLSAQSEILLCQLCSADIPDPMKQ